MAQLSEVGAEAQPLSPLKTKIVTAFVAVVLCGILFAVFNPQLVVALSGT